MPYSLARSGTLMPAAYRARISALRSTFLGVLGDSGVEVVGEPGYSRFTREKTASSKVKIKLPSALKACGSQCPIGAYTPGDSTRLIMHSIMGLGSFTGVRIRQTSQYQMELCPSMKETCAFAKLMLLEPRSLTSFENIRFPRNACIKFSATTNTYR